MYQALYRKYRPKTFDDVVGEEHITGILKNELKSGKIFHAYLFTGPRGTGKTSCAKILAKAVNCLNLNDGDACLECASCKAIENGDVLDITEIDAASNNGVENIRDLREQVSYTPTSSKYRVYIIDEVHMLSIGAFNALLKTLEEPPAHIVFILATTEVHKLPATILSRCQRFDFHRISAEAISDRLQKIAEAESITLDKMAADMIAALCDGGMRDALSTLDLCAARTNHITEDDVLQVCSLAGDNYCLQLAELIKGRDVGAALLKVDELHKSAVDLKRLTGEMISHYRNLMIAKTVKNIGSLIVCAPKTLEQLKTQAADYSIEAILNAINVFSLALEKMSNSDRRTELEMAVVKLCTPSLDDSPSALLDRIEKIERMLKYSGAQKVQAGAQVATNTNVPITTSDTTKDQIPPEAVTKAVETSPSPEQSNTSSGLVLFEAWQDVLSELLKTAPLMAASLSGSTAYLENDDILRIDSENEQFFSLMKSTDPIYRNQIKSAVLAVVGRSYRLGPYKKPAEKSNDPLGDIINKLKELEVPGN